MCWSETASVAMVGIGGAATAMAVLRREPAGIWLALGYFTVMEGLQSLGYSVVDQCGEPSNRAVTLLSYLHIAFQPLVINAFTLAIVPRQVTPAARRLVYGLCLLSAGLMVAQLMPLDWAGECRPGSVLCGPELCLVSGSWHIAWEVPYNGMLNRLEDALGFRLSFPGYVLCVFVMPLFYGAWRFVLFHVFAGPVLAFLLTDDPNEWPAVWCLFSIGLVLIAMSPTIRAGIAPAPAEARG